MQEDQQPPQTGWQFTPVGPQNVDSGVPQPQPSQDLDNRVDWTASEYVAHDKNIGWYSVAVLATLLIAVLVYFITGKSWFSALMMLIGGGVFVAAAARPPKVLNYSVDERSLVIGSKIYMLSNFKSFSVIEEGPIQSILLIPLERFMPGLTVYYDPKDETRITTVLGASLPYEERQAPFVDKMMRKIRF
jgi:hypothetical protein